MDVRMPDGTIVTNVPEGTTQSELLRRLESFDANEGITASPEGEPPLPDTPSTAPNALEAFGRAALVRFLGNMGAIPETVLQSLTPDERRRGGIPGPIEAVSDLVDTVTGGAVDPQSAGPAARAQLQGVLSGENILGFGEALSNPLEPGLIPRAQEAQERQRETSQRFREQAPVASVVGDVAGDIATIATGRAGLRGGQTSGPVPPSFLATQLQGRAAATVAANLPELAPVIGARAQSIIGRSLQTFAKSAGKTGRRALGTGAEGAFLAALSDSDPITVAAGGAGAQVVGDTALGVFKDLRGKGGGIGLGLLKAVALTTLGSLGLQQLTPGGLDRILPTIEARNKDVIVTALLGGGVGAITGGRIPKDLFPKAIGGEALSEIVDVTRRGALLSMLTSLSRDPVRTAPVIQKFSEDPDFFGDKAKRLLTRAINSEKIDIRNTIDGLMEDREFKRRFDSLER